jgi:hypothetical protein
MKKAPPKAARHEAARNRAINALGRLIRAVRGSHLRRIRDSLDGLPRERFFRLIGWFHTMVPETKKQRDRAGNYLHPITREFDHLRKMIEQKCLQDDVRFHRDELGDHVHNLHLLLGKLLPAEALEASLPATREDYRVRVASDTYNAYTASPTYKALAGCKPIPDGVERFHLLQADFIQLINEIRKLHLLDYHVEETRTYVIKNLRRTLYKLIAVPAAIVLLFLILRTTNSAAFGSAAGTAQHALVLATLLSLAAITGAVGSFISALLRIAAVPESTEVARNAVALRYSESIRLSPVTGFVFAILLCFIFGGHLINGILFPNTDGLARWPDLLFSAAELAKLVVWAFLVGFAERLMPDMLDRMVAKAGNPAQQPAPAVSHNGTKPVNFNGAGRNGAGHNGAGHHAARLPVGANGHAKKR